jgi:hypothetical protein
MRRQLVWLVILPLSLVGAVCGHAVLNELMGSGSRDELLVGGGLGSDLVPEFLVVVSAVVLLALCGRVLGVGGSPRRSVTAMPFACVTPVLFILQEHVEAYLHGGGIPIGTVLEPAFLPGLALQLPFALGAYLLALALLRAADGVRRLIGRTGVVRLRRDPHVSPRRPSVGRPRTSVLTAFHSGRGPPSGALGPLTQF